MLIFSTKKDKEKIPSHGFTQIDFGKQYSSKEENCHYYAHIIHKLKIFFFKPMLRNVSDQISHIRTPPPTSCPSVYQTVRDTNRV